MSNVPLWGRSGAKTVRQNEPKHTAWSGLHLNLPTGLFLSIADKNLPSGQAEMQPAQHRCVWLHSAYFSGNTGRGEYFMTSSKTTWAPTGQLGEESPTRILGLFRMIYGSNLTSHDEVYSTQVRVNGK